MLNLAGREPASNNMRATHFTCPMVGGWIAVGWQGCDRGRLPNVEFWRHGRRRSVASPGSELGRWTRLGQLLCLLVLAGVLSACSAGVTGSAGATPPAGKGKHARAFPAGAQSARPAGAAGSGLGSSRSTNGSSSTVDEIVAAWKRSQSAFEQAFAAPGRVDATGLTPALDASVAPGSPAFTGIASTLMTMKMNGWVGTQPPSSLGHPVVTVVHARSALVATCFDDTQIAVAQRSHLPVSGPLGVPDHIEVSSTMIATASGSWLLYSTTARVVPACSGGRA